MVGSVELTAGELAAGALSAPETGLTIPAQNVQLSERAMAYRLVIGNKNTSSWSLRPWIAMRHFGIPFTEVNINLRAPDAKAQILSHSPAGKVPALLTDERRHLG